MILLFLGSWRSTLIIAISIPLAILSSSLLRRHYSIDSINALQNTPILR
jgi:multidrug efflux pump subunit AcrB